MRSGNSIASRQTEIATHPPERRPGPRTRAGVRVDSPPHGEFRQPGRLRPETARRSGAPHGAPRVGARDERQLQRGRRARSAPPRDHRIRRRQGIAVRERRRRGGRRCAARQRRRASVRGSPSSRRGREDARRRGGPAHPLGLEHGPDGRDRRRGDLAPGLRDAEGARGRHNARARGTVPILENAQDMPKLARDVEAILTGRPEAHAFLLRRHGLYTWGRDLSEAVRHVEILEFLFEVVGRSRRRD